MNEKMCKIETIKNVVPYIYIYTPISMWSGFMWIYGKLNVPVMQNRWIQTISRYDVVESILKSSWRNLHKQREKKAKKVQQTTEWGDRRQMAQNDNGPDKNSPDKV